MKTTLRGCVALVVVLATATATAASGGIGPSTIRITDVELAHRIVDHAPRGTGPGDVEVVRVRLYNPSITPKSIGRGDMVCTFVDARARVCNGAYTLPKGKVVVSGTIASRLLYDLAVVGGTGLYDGARGSVTVTATSFRPRHEVMVFRLDG